jgi:acetyl-CoA carboxylase carboxyltransferase component
LNNDLVYAAYQKGKAINAASFLEFDEVIDPKDTRKWISTGLSIIDENTYNKGTRNAVDSW